MNKKVAAGLSILVLSLLACEPVFVIGWREIFIVLGLIAFLFGPPIYRFIRTFDDFLKSRKKKDK